MCKSADTKAQCLPTAVRQQKNLWAEGYGFFMKKRICSVTLCIMMVLTCVANITFAEGQIVNQNYSENFDNIGKDEQNNDRKLPVGWTLQSGPADKITVRKIDQISTPALGFGEAQYAAPVSGTVSLDTHVWNRPYTINFKYYQWKDSDTPGYCRTYLNYGEAASYAVCLKFGKGVKIIKIADGQEEDVGTATSNNCESWDGTDIAIAMQAGKIIVSDNRGELASYTDASIKPNGGIAFGADGATAFIDNVSVVVAEETETIVNQPYEQNFDDIADGALPNEWVKQSGEFVSVENLEKAWGDPNPQKNPALRFGNPENDYQSMDGLAYLDGYTWNEPYAININVLTRQKSGDARIYVNYGTDTSYAVGIKFEGNAAIYRVVGGEATQVAESTRTCGTWFSIPYTVEVQDGKIVVSDGEGELTSYTDATIKPNGGIALGTVNTTASFDDISIALIPERSENVNQPYRQTFEGVEVGQLPAEWKLTADWPENFIVIEDDNTHATNKDRVLLFGKKGNDYQGETGLLALEEYYWDAPYTLRYTLRSRQGAGTFRTYVNYSKNAYYVVEFQHKNASNEGKVKILKKANGSSSEEVLAVSTEEQDLWDDRDIMIRVEGSTISVYTNKSKLQYADTTNPITGGSIAIATNNSTAIVDDFTVTVGETPSVELVGANVLYTEGQDKIPTTSLSGLQGKTVTIQARVAVKDENQGIVPIIAIGDGCAYAVAERQTDDGGNAVKGNVVDVYTATIQLPDTMPNDASVKVLVWSGFTGMVPLCNASIVIGG